MKNTLRILSVLMLLSLSSVHAQRVLILPDQSVSIDNKKKRACRRIVDRINRMTLKCDTVSSDPLDESRSSYRFEAIYFDTEGCLRKYVSERGIRDTGCDHSKMAAYYDPEGELVYIEHETSSHCECLEEYYYVDRRRIVDFSCELECDCCEEPMTPAEIDALRPAVGNLLTSERAWVTDYIHVDSLLFSLRYSTYENEGVTQVLPRVFRIEEAQEEVYDRLDRIGGVVTDSIENPKGYVIRTTYGEELIAIKKSGGGYRVFNLIPGEIRPGISKIERRDINGSGSDELIVRWETKTERSGWRDGFSVRESVVVVWDLDTFSCLLNFKDAHEYSFWWREYSDSGDEVVNSGGESECGSYKVELGEKRLTIQKDRQCPNGVFGLKYIYKLKDVGFMLDKVNEPH